MLRSFLFTLFIVSSTTAAYSQEPAEAAAKETKKEIPKAEPPKEETVVTSHTTRIGGIDVSYKATAGTQLLTDEKGDPKATIFYVAYTKDNAGDLRQRPVTFCFNGGPGSASVWLHLGLLGPQRVAMDDMGEVPIQPYKLIDNPYSLLDITDLVFIDPVSTGYSRAVTGEDAKQFHSVEKDIDSVASFIRLYTTRNLRWESPKFLAGESYGTTRAAALAQKLHDYQFLYLNGIMLFSTVLNFQTIAFDDGNDLPYILFLPTYTAAAFYHKKLPDDLQQNMQNTLHEAEQFASGDYAHALMQGDKLDPIERANIVEKVARYTGVSPEYVEQSNLRMEMMRYAKELLRKEKRTIGRFDARQKGFESDQCSETFKFDPSIENVLGAFTATFNQYVRADLGWKKDEEYKVIAEVNPWDFSKATNQYLEVSSKLHDVMNKNPRLTVFVASGNWDLATPYYATDYTFSHLGLDPALRQNVTMKLYDGGHMIYLVPSTLVKLKTDMTQYINKSLEGKQ